MFAGLIEFISSLILSGGYFVIVICMALESMIFPLPSEAVMPFAGFLIAQGKLSWFGVIFFSTLGSIIGSLISYYIGLYGGRPFLEKYGRYFLLNKKHLDWTERWFNKDRGWLTVFICRFIPVVRHLISIPAGAGKMKKRSFLSATIIGAGMWNTFLAYLGFLLNKNWELVGKYSTQFDIFIIVILVSFILFLVYRKLKH